MITLNEKRYRVREAIAFLMDATTQYMHEAVQEQRSTKPDFFKIESFFNLAHSSILSLEGIVLMANRNRVRVDEGSLQAVKDLHSQIHALMHNHEVMLRALREVGHSMTANKLGLTEAKSLN